ncbi:MAG TPA: hypothetical protein VFM18_11700 [Methanosarcina sp.]|nr:hypothetical protein [Methanosarcina sp.]
MSTLVADANALVTYIQSFTGSTDTNEIKDCIKLSELMMRNIELPGLRTNPYTTTATADANGRVNIPTDMNRPILFFKMGTGGSQTNPNGPWLVYDRIGDRDMITQQLVENLYLKPLNIPQVYRGKFSEVGQQYEFLPGLAQGDVINMYYFTTWPLLFSLETDGLTTVLNNVVLQSFPEGYIFATLHNYYYKRKMAEDADKWLAKFQLAWDTIEDQNNKGKWSGGHNRLQSIWQPRTARRYSMK